MKTRLLLFFLLAATLSKAQDMDVLHYRFALELNDNNDTIYGNAGIVAVLKEAGAVQLDLVQMDGNGKGMQVVKVEKDESSEAYPFKQENDKLILPLIKGAPGDTLRFRIVYKGVPADGLVISKNKFGDRTFFGDNWPNRAHHWLPCIDRPDDKATFEFLVTAPSHYGIISNGRKVEEKELENGKRFTHWKEAIALPTKVMVIGAARFATKTFDESPAAILVSAWVYPQDSTKGFYDFAVAPSILRFFSGYIAPFPYSKLANVQSTTIFGGMENASCIFYAENLVTGDRSSEETVAHEIAHQWFGDMASEKSFAHLWLSEGFATYMTDIYFEKTYDKEAARARLQQEREEVIAFARSSKSAVVDSTTNLMSLLNANSYQKGAWVLHMLRKEVGDTTFQKIIQTYYNTYKGGNAETRDLEAVAEKVSGKELTWFFNQWLHQPGVPKLMLKKTVSNEGVRLVAAQMQKNLYQLSLPVSLETTTGKAEVTTVRLTDRVTSVLLTKDKLAKVSVDPDVTLLYEEVR